MIDFARGRVLFVAAALLIAAIGWVTVRAIGARDDQPPTKLLDNPLYAGRRLSEWIILLESEDDGERLGAARSLGDMGPSAKGAVPWLIKSLSDRGPNIPVAAAWSLGEIGPEAASAIPAMVNTFKRSNGFNKGIIGPAIGHIGARAVPALMELSNESNEFVRWEATRALGIVGPGASAAEARLIELLSDKKSDIRVEATFALWKLRRRHSAIDELARALDDQDESARASAADHLAEIGAEAARAIPGLIRALADQSDSVRNRATNALGKIGAPAKVGIPALLQAAAHPGHWFFLEKAIKGIGAEAIPALIEGLDDPKGRLPAVEALGQFGAVAKAAAPRLRALLEHARGEERARISLALWRIRRDRAVVSVMSARARENNFIVQLRALDALEEIGPDAKDAIPMLIDMLGSKDRFLREHAATALGRIGPQAKSAIPALEKTLRNPEMSNRIAAAKALWQIAHSPAALAALSNEARNFADYGSTFAVMALGEIGPEAKAAVPALIEALNADSIFRQAIVAQAIAKIGPEARAAIPPLIEIHNDIHNTARASFAKSIKAIDPQAGARAGIR